MNLAASMASCTSQGNCGDEQFQAQAQRAEARVMLCAMYAAVYRRFFEER